LAPYVFAACRRPDAQALVSAGEADALLQINPSPARDALYDYSDSFLE
jgi:hypothetical protein